MKNEHIDPCGLETQSGAAKWIVTRRDFLKASASIIAGLSVGSSFAYADKTNLKTKLRFGIVTDPHYANADAKGSRYYRESLTKMTECVTLMNNKKVNFLVEVGDFKDQDKPANEKNTMKYLQTIEKTFQKFEGPRYHVLGNHDTDSISKAQFLHVVRNTNIPQESKYYSFDSKEIHFVVLDANYCSDGSDYDHGNFDWTDANIPRKEIDWLKKDLASSSKPVIIFVHQQLDGKCSHCVKNAALVRQILQKNKRVLAVFQGHNHAGHYSSIDGIHYYTLKAMVEGSGKSNNSYAIIAVHNNLDITVTGYRKALSKKLEKA